MQQDDILVQCYMSSLLYHLKKDPSLRKTEGNHYSKWRYKYKCSQGKSESRLLHLPPLSVTPGCSLGRPSPPPDRCPSSHSEPRCGLIIRTGRSSPAPCSSCHSPLLLALAIYFHRFSLTAGALVRCRSSICTLWHSFFFVPVAPFSLDPFWTGDVWLTTWRRLPTTRPV